MLILTLTDLRVILNFFELIAFSWHSFTRIFWFVREGITEQILEYLEQAAVMISLAGAAVIVGGFLLAAGRYMAQFRQLGPARDFAQFKVELGQALMLGLEILVVADVIETITSKSTFTSLVLLACLVAIRTVVSWTLCLEVEGRWPWQAAEEG